MNGHPGGIPPSFKRPNYPDGIPPHTFERRKGPAMHPEQCDYCGKIKEHATHQQPATIKK